MCLALCGKRRRHKHRSSIDIWIRVKMSILIEKHKHFETSIKCFKFFTNIKWIWYKFHTMPFCRVYLERPQAFLGNSYHIRMKWLKIQQSILVKTYVEKILYSLLLNAKKKRIKFKLIFNRNLYGDGHWKSFVSYWW